MLERFHRNKSIDIEFMLVNILCSLLVKDSGYKMNLQEFITPDILLRKR